MSKVKKILVCGNVDGHFTSLFKRVTSVNNKTGPFELLLCVGNFFAADGNDEWNPYKIGSSKVPLPTFILGPSVASQKAFYPDIRGCELAENVIYLGPFGVYQSSSGLTIAYLSGSLDAPADLCGYSNHKVGQLEAEIRQAGVIDILVTSCVPSHVTTFTTKPEGLEDKACALVARLAASAQPRYHFSSLPQLFYERLPYRNHRVLQEPPRQVTRFLCLAGVDNSAKRKWLYAFFLTPAMHCKQDELTAQPPDVTESPYNEALLPPLHQESDEMNKYFYGGGSKQGKKRTRDEESEGARRQRGPPQPTGPCWFCLSSPDVEKHLIVSVGEHCYLALAKGGLVAHHLMLLPIHHYQTSLDLEPAAQQELTQFKSSLQKLFAASGRSAVFYERNYRTTHMQLHAVPLPNAVANNVSDVFQSMAAQQDLQLEEVPRRTELSAAVKSGQPFLLVEPPSGPCLLLRVRKGYNMLFDRQVLASEELLNVPSRVDWKDCKGTREQETSLRDQVRQMFAPYDFTADQDGDSSGSDSE